MHLKDPVGSNAVVAMTIGFEIFLLAVMGVARASPFLPPGIEASTLHFCFTQATSNLGIYCKNQEVVIIMESSCGHSDSIGLQSCPKDNPACEFALTTPMTNCHGRAQCSLDAARILGLCEEAMQSRKCGQASYVNIRYICLPLTSTYVLSMCGSPGFSRTGGYIMSEEYPASVPDVEKYCYCAFSHPNATPYDKTLLSVEIVRAELRGDANLPPCHEKLTTYSSALILNSRCNNGTSVDETLFRRTLTESGGPHSVAFVRKDYPSEHQGKILLSFSGSSIVRVQCFEVDYDPSLTPGGTTDPPRTTSPTTTPSTRAPSTSTQSTTPLDTTQTTAAPLTQGANVGLIVGIIVGFVLVLLIICLLVFFICPPKRFRAPSPREEKERGPQIQHIHNERLTTISEAVVTPVKRPVSPEDSIGVSPWGLQYIEEKDQELNASDDNDDEQSTASYSGYNSNNESLKPSRKGVAYNSDSGESGRVVVPPAMFAVLEFNHTPSRRTDDDATSVSTVRTAMSSFDMTGPFHADVYLCTGPSHQQEPMPELSVIDNDMYTDQI